MINIIKIFYYMSYNNIYRSFFFFAGKFQDVLTHDSGKHLTVIDSTMNAVHAEHCLNVPIISITVEQFAISPTEMST